MELYKITGKKDEGTKPTAVNENENETYVMLYDTMMLWNLNEEVCIRNSCVVMRRGSKSRNDEEHKRLNEWSVSQNN